MPDSVHSYIVRNGPFRGRNVRALREDQIREIIDHVPADAEAAAGLRLMRYILEKQGPEAVIGFVEWGHGILNTTGKISKIDFIPDEDDPPLTGDERKMLEVSTPDMLTRRNVLYLLPSALLTLLGLTHVGSRAMEATYDQLHEDVSEAGKKDADPEPEISDKKNPFTRVRKNLDDISGYPVEAIGAIILINEIIDIVREYEPKKFEEISNAVAEVADTMGIGEATPTYRLPHASRIRPGGERKR